MSRYVFALVIVACSMQGSPTINAAEPYGLTPGPVEMLSVGPMDFGPDNVLFVGDPKAAKVHAILVDDEKQTHAEYDLKNLNAAIKVAFGVDMSIVDMTANPQTGSVFVSLTGNGKNVIARIGTDGKVEPISLEKVAHSTATLSDAPDDKVVQRGRRRSNPRDSSITDLAFMEGKLLVAGLQSGDAPSAVREFDFPFREQSRGMSVEIFHAAHGRDENYAPIQTFVPFNIGGEPSLLAGYVCTPLVKIPISKMADQSQIKGTTVAELGNRNRPLDMIAYKRDGNDYLLMANSARGVMKITTQGLESNKGLTERVSGGGTAGQTYDTIDSLQGVVQLAKVDNKTAVVITKTDSDLALKTIALP